MDKAIPVMTLDEGVKNMSLNGRDPVVDAVKGGKPPTLRDVKRSVKVSDPFKSATLY